MNVMPHKALASGTGDPFANSDADLPSEILRALRTLISWVGDDPGREGLLDTPTRTARAWRDSCRGYVSDPGQHLARTFGEVAGYDEVVMLTGIPFQSICESDMVPFTGKASIAYLPRDRVVGISKLARVLHGFACRLQTQERLTAEVANSIWDNLAPRAVAVVIQAQHGCAAGGDRYGNDIVTSRMLGLFRDDPRSREEVLKLMRHGDRLKQEQGK